jgi:hypothetical protein
MLIVTREGQTLNIETMVEMKDQKRLMEITSGLEKEPVAIEFKCPHISVTFKTMNGSLIVLHN